MGLDRVDASNWRRKRPSVVQALGRRRFRRRAYEALLPPLTTEQIEALAASGRRAR